jgi:hypothetical protein
LLPASRGWLRGGGSAGARKKAFIPASGGQVPDQRGEFPLLAMSPACPAAI